MQVTEVGTSRDIPKVRAAGATADAKITVTTTAAVAAAPHLLTTLLHKIGVWQLPKCLPTGGWYQPCPSQPGETI